MRARYVPDAGDIVWVDFAPQRGHEQAGRRSAVVLSPRIYNGKAGLMVCVPVTSQIKGYPFEVVLGGAGASGAALADQIKSLDWQARNAERKGKAAPAEMAAIRTRIQVLIGGDQPSN